jgi:hypothetical protein
MTLTRTFAPPVVLATALMVTGCSSSSGPAPAPTGSRTGSSPAAATRAAALAAALQHPKHSPRPTSVSCHPASAQEIAKGPFGTGPQPQYTCRLGIGGTTARYDVQVQSNGCYVAERQRTGKAIYGCGAAGSSG